MCSPGRIVGRIAVLDPVSLVAGEHSAYHESWMKLTYNAPAQDPEGSIAADVLLREEPEDEEEDEDEQDDEDNDGDEGYSE